MSTLSDTKRLDRDSDRWEAVDSIPNAKGGPSNNAYRRVFIPKKYDTKGSGGVVCRVCGAMYPVLSSHISRKHGLLRAEYRAQYGADAPYFTGELIKEMVETGKRVLSVPENMAAVREGMRTKWADPKTRTAWITARGQRERPINRPCALCGKVAVAGQNKQYCSHGCSDAANSGERHPRARWTATQVADIRRRYAAGETQEHLAAAFGTKQSRISELVRLRTWRFVEKTNIKIAAHNDGEVQDVNGKNQNREA